MTSAAPASETTSIATYVPLAVAAISALALIGVAVYNARADDLKRAERLATLTSGMSETSARTLMEDARDALAISWVLRRSAPRVPRLAGLSVSFLAVGVLGGVTVILANQGMLPPSPAWPIMAYGGSGIGGGLWGARRVLRRAWIQRQMNSRGLKPPFENAPYEEYL